MVTIYEAKSLAKSIYLQSAALSGLEVSEKSPTALANLIDDAYQSIKINRQPEAVANMLKVIAATLEEAQFRGESQLGETSIRRGSNKVCPVYPFD